MGEDWRGAANPKAVVCSVPSEPRALQAHERGANVDVRGWNDCPRRWVKNGVEDADLFTY